MAEPKRQKRKWASRKRELRSQQIAELNLPAAAEAFARMSNALQFMQKIEEHVRKSGKNIVVPLKPVPLDMQAYQALMSSVFEHVVHASTTGKTEMSVLETFAMHALTYMVPEAQAVLNRQLLHDRKPRQRRRRKASNGKRKPPLNGGSDPGKI